MINASALLKFFDPRGQIGRWPYFKSLLFRSILGAIIVTLIKSLLFGTSSPMPEYHGHGLLDSQQWLATRAPGERIVGGMLRIFLNGPIAIRRCNDLRIDYRWLIPLYFYFLVPWQLFPINGNGVGLWVLLSVFTFIFQIILYFKPGQAHKDFIRSKEQSA